MLVVQELILMQVSISCIKIELMIVKKNNMPEETQL